MWYPRVGKQHLVCTPSHIRGPLILAERLSHCKHEGDFSIVCGDAGKCTSMSTSTSEAKSKFEFEFEFGLNFRGILLYTGVCLVSCAVVHQKALIFFYHTL